MAVTYKLISSYRTTGSEASITIGSIPNTYTDLMLVYNGRASTETVVVQFTFNNDTGSTSYSNKQLQWNAYFGSTGGSMSTENSISYAKSFNSYSTRAPNVFGGGQIYIPGYRAAQPKSPITDTGFASGNNVSANINDVWGQLGGSLYNTNTAISSIKLVCEGSPTTQWIVDSTFYLYGISNA
jgi:hypothetical protein